MPNITRELRDRAKIGVGMTGLKNAIGIIYSPTGDLGLKGCNINAKQASDVHKGIIRQKRQEKHTQCFCEGNH